MLTLTIKNGDAASGKRDGGSARAVNEGSGANGLMNHFMHSAQLRFQLIDLCYFDFLCVTYLLLFAWV